MGLSAEQKQIGTNSARTKEQTEGEKLRTRAVMLCKDELFRKFALEVHTKAGLSFSHGFNEDAARAYICNTCCIASRSELATNLEAQVRFRRLVQKHIDWKFENRYMDNLERM